ncbi:MAG: AAA family ATPase [Cellulomonadaceae bacterium]|nr:AAA family ATPase [Cellulomonadaceae bacterium]
MTLINRLETLKGDGLYEDFRWSTGTRSFRQVNVVYGRNGSGKTTLAAAFREAREDSVARSRFSLTFDGEAPTGGRDHPAFVDVLVFGRDFVQENQEFGGATPTMPAVLTLGRSTIEAERELRELRAQLPELQTTCVHAATELTRAQTGLDDALRALSRRVVEELTRVGGRYQSAGKYSMRTAEDRLSQLGGRSVELDAEALTHARDLVHSPGRPPIATTIGVPALRPGFEGELLAALGTTPVTLVLDTLERHPDATGWVQAGRSLHRESEECIYCGGPLTAVRRAEIEAHFSDEVTRVEATLAGLDRELSALLDQVAHPAWPRSADLYADLTEKYDLALAELSEQAVGLKGWILQARQAIVNKRANVLVAVAGPTIPLVQLYAATLISVLDEHNARAARHDAAVNDAALRIEEHHLAGARGEIAERRTALSETEARDAAARQAQKDALARIDLLATTKGDPAPSAEALTFEVARLLGRSELEFRPRGENTYAVTRSDGSPAVGLSEGERTAITLVHFLEALARREPEAPAPIVLVDDPVSSLDANVWVGASTLIWARCVVEKLAAQLFVLTHDFELFRQWQYMIDGAKPVGVTGESYELRARYVSGRRRAELESWPTNGKDGKPIMLSTYHHAFAELAEAQRRLLTDDSFENRLNAQLLFPNVLRRVLETFVAFKRPGRVGNFTVMMGDCIDGLTPHEQKQLGAGRVHLTRFAHQYSHSESPDTTLVIPPDELATTITQTFRLMSIVDATHFDGLCRITQNSPADLLNDGPSIL